MSTTQHDWHHWAETLGLKQHLLPVVSDITTPIHPVSALKELGKTPSRIANGRAVGIPGWTKHEATDKDIGRWSADERHGICVQGRGLRGLDVDIPNMDAAARVRDFVQAWLTEHGLVLPDIRGRDGTGKFLMPFEMRTEMRKRVLHTPHGAIEWLADGCQWIARRDHVSSPVYRWSDSDGCPVRNPTTIGKLLVEQFESMWAALKSEFHAEEYRENEVGLMPTKPRTAADTAAGVDDLDRWMGENGWGLGYDQDGKRRIRCPFGDEHSSGEPGDGSTVYFPAGTGGFERGHFRCLHAHCAGRKDGDFIARMGYLNDDFEVIEAPPVALDEDGAPKLRPAGLTVNNRTGLIDPSLANIDLCLAHPKWSGVGVGFDAFEHKRIIRWAGKPWQPFTDASYTDIRLHLVRACGVAEASEANVKAVCLRAEREGRFDSAQDWIGKLKWDGIPRLDNFARDYLGCGDSAYARAVGRYMLTAMAGRVAAPGCKADMVPVMVGPQGWRKSGVLKALAMTPEAFLEMAFDPQQEDDNKRKQAGKLVIELAEMKGLNKRDNDALKEFIVRQYEEWVPKYMETPRRFPRRAIMVGTTNRPNWLPYDQSGYRRWLPIVVERECDTAATERDAEQLWAEAYVAWSRDGIEWQEAERRAKAGDVWAPFVDGDHRDGRVAEWLGERSEFDVEGVATTNGDGLVLTSQVISGALGVPLGRQTRADELLVSRVLRTLGYGEVRERHNGARQRGWRKP